MCVGASLGDRLRLACASHDCLTLRRLAVWHLVLVARYLYTPISSNAYGGLGAYQLVLIMTQWAMQRVAAWTFCMPHS